MKCYEQDDFKAIERDECGYKHLPSGNWTKVDFGADNARLIFANDCRLGDNCELGDNCTLGSDCTLGDGCTLGGSCELGDGCTLGDNCTLDND